MDAPAPAISATAPGQELCGPEEQHALVPAGCLVRHLSEVSQKQLSADIVQGVVEGLPLRPSSVSDVCGPHLRLERVPGDSRAVDVTVVHHFRVHFDEALPASPDASASQPPLLLTAAAGSCRGGAGSSGSGRETSSGGSSSCGGGSGGSSVLRVEELPQPGSSDSLCLAASASGDLSLPPGPASAWCASGPTALRPLVCQVEVPESPQASSRSSSSGGSAPASGGSAPAGSRAGMGLAGIKAPGAADRAGSGSAPASAPTPSAGEPGIRMGSTPELSSGSSSASAGAAEAGGGAAAAGGCSGDMQQQDQQRLAQRQPQQMQAPQQQAPQQHQQHQQHRIVQQQQQQEQRARVGEPLLLQPPPVWEPAAVARDEVARRFSQDQEWAQQMQRRRSPMLRQDSLMPFEINPHDILVGDRLAVGGFAEVFVGRYQGTAVAIKLLLSVDERGQESFRQEVHVLERLRHPNIVLFMGVCTRPYLAILSEYMARGSLFKLLRRSGNRPLPRKLQRSVAVSVARGMSYLHSRSPPLLHLDLKSPNILLDERWRVKIADFGLARLKSSACMSTGAGTPEWMAPEILRSESYDERADVYSYGVVLHECLTGRQPWEGLHPMQVVGAVGFQGKQLGTDGMEGDPFIIALCLRCLSSDPRLRPSFTEVLQDIEHNLAPHASRSNSLGSHTLGEGGTVLEAPDGATAAAAAAVATTAAGTAAAAATLQAVHALHAAEAAVHDLPALPPLVPPRRALRLPAGVVRPGGGAGVPGVGMIGAPHSPRDGEPLPERPYGGYDPSPFAPSSGHLPLQTPPGDAPLDDSPAAGAPPAAPQQPPDPSPFASPFDGQQSPFGAPEQQHEEQAAGGAMQPVAAGTLAGNPAAVATPAPLLSLHPAFSMTNDSPFAQLPPFDDADEDEAEEEGRGRGGQSGPTVALEAISEGGSRAVSSSSSLGLPQPDASEAAELAGRLHMCQLSSFSRSHNSSSGDLPEGGSRLSSGSLVRQPSSPFVTLAEAVSWRPSGDILGLAKQRSAGDVETPLPGGAAPLASPARSSSQGLDPGKPMGTQTSTCTVGSPYDPPSFASAASMTEPEA